MPNSIHIPIDELDNKMDKVKEAMEEYKVTDKDGKNCLYNVILGIDTQKVYVICRLGNDSQIAVRMMQKKGIEQPKDIIGGLYRWSMKVDNTFPIY